MKKEKRWDKKGNMRYRLFDKWTGAMQIHTKHIRESWVLRRWCRIKMISFACIGRRGFPVLWMIKTRRAIDTYDILVIVISSGGGEITKRAEKCTRIIIKMGVIWSWLSFTKAKFFCFCMHVFGLWILNEWQQYTCNAINTQNIFLHHLSLLLYFFPFYL